MTFYDTLPRTASASEPRLPVPQSRPLGYLDDPDVAGRFGLGLEKPPSHVRLELWRRQRFWRARGYRLPAGIFVIAGRRR